MKYDSEQPRDEFEDQLPQGLVDDLRGLYGGVRPGGERDRRILAAARAEFLRRDRYRLWRRVGGAAAAVAAMVLVAVVLWPGDSGRVERADRSATPAVQDAVGRAVDAKDLNTDGRVNILDAYLLAKRVERMEMLDRAMDFNADGEVDRRDADAIAAAAVELKEGDLQ